MLMVGKMSSGVRSSITGLIRMSTSASTINVYGRESASLTIHICAFFSTTYDVRPAQPSARDIPFIRPAGFPRRQPDLSPAGEPCVERVAARSGQRERAREDKHEREQKDPGVHLGL